MSLLVSFFFSLNLDYFRLLRDREKCVYFIRAQFAHKLAEMKIITMF